MTDTMPEPLAETATIIGAGGTVWAKIVDHVADVRLNRPEKLNALNAAMFADLLEVGLALRERSEVRAVVLSGAGRAFCVGLDYSAFSAMLERDDWWDTESADGQRPEVLDPDDDMIELNRGQRAVCVWGTLPVPVIAAVGGPAFGGGLQLALGADIRIVAPEATLSVAEVRWGLIPDMAGTQLLPRLVGMDVAMELTVTGKVITGEEAARIGLATRIADDPRAEALELAREIAGRNPDAVRAAKSLLDHAWHLPFGDGLAAERETMARIVGSANQREAVRARLAKRAPVFADPVPTDPDESVLHEPAPDEPAEAQPETPSDS